MKAYTVKYELKGYGYITVAAEDENDAKNEIDRIFCNDEPRHDENNWIDDNVLWDIEWTTTDVIDANEI